MKISTLKANVLGIVLTRHYLIITFLICFWLLISVCSPLLHAQDTIVIHPTVGPTVFKGLQVRVNGNLGRPKVGLVLSGGGARGLAQIGVLRALERHHIPIDLVVGNSLGSVVGGLYASGYSITQIESITVHANWNDLLSFSEDTKRTDLFLEQKQTQEKGYLVLRFEGIEPVIPSSISGGQRLSDFFSRLTLQAIYHPNPSFDDLKIPYRAIATDLISGKRVILDHGSLAEAMRASVTVPLLYSPLERDSMYLVDGGLVSNIPADVARTLGCDIVIVVNSTSSMRNANQMTAPWEIADQIMTIMMQEGNKRQMALADVVITPDGGSRIVSDFSGIDSLIGMGEIAGEESAGKIDSLIRSFGDTLRTIPDGRLSPMNSILIDGPIPKTLRDEIMQQFDRHGLTFESVKYFVNKIAATGNNNKVYAEITRSHQSGMGVIFHQIVYPRIPQISYTGNNLIKNPEVDRELSPIRQHTLDGELMRQSLERVIALYRDRGYSLARIDTLTFDRDSGNIYFHLNEGSIKQIRYEGNFHTKDYILRREFPLDEGDIFNIDKATQGIVNIKSTGLFDYVLLDVRYIENQPIIIIRVKEKSPELLRAGLHVDNEHSFVTTIDARDANFRGAWEDLGLIARYGYRDRSAEFGYTINRIFNSYYTFNLKGYLTSRDVFTYKDDFSPGTLSWDRVENGSYRKDIYGWSFSFGRHFERFGDMSAQFRMENHKLTGLSGEGYTPEQFHFASLRLQSTIDTKNKFLFPTEGTYASFSYESASERLGSEVGFGKVDLTYESYLTLSPGHTIRPKFTFGFADRTLPLTEQYTLGGLESFYGLREDDSYGRQILLINFEYRYSLPVKIIFDSYLKLRYDLVSISLVPEELKLRNFRHGYGVELALDTPLGDVSIGLGQSFYPRQDLPKTPIGFGPLLVYFSIGPAL
jgi:NTE family protein